MNSPGEQSYQYSRADNNNWNGTLTVNYRIDKAQMLTFNHVLNAFHRFNTSLLAKEEQKEAIACLLLKRCSVMKIWKWEISVSNGILPLDT
jgi:hypothetical protein